jgi:hypothetical protein
MKASSWAEGKATPHPRPSVSHEIPSQLLTRPRQKLGKRRRRTRMAEPEQVELFASRGTLPGAICVSLWSCREANHLSAWTPTRQSGGSGPAAHVSVAHRADECTPLLRSGCRVRSYRVFRPPNFSRGRDKSWEDERVEGGFVRGGGGGRMLFWRRAGRALRAVDRVRRGRLDDCLGPEGIPRCRPVSGGFEARVFAACGLVERAGGG